MISGKLRIYGESRRVWEPRARDRLAQAYELAITECMWISDSELQSVAEDRKVQIMRIKPIVTL